MQRVVLVVMSFGITCGVLAQNERVMSDAEAAHFWGVPRTQLTWTDVTGPDFHVYNGITKPPLSGAVSIYMGDYPEPLSDYGATVVDVKLGNRTMRWYKFRRDDGTLAQRTQFHFGYTWDVWVYSDRQSDLDVLVKELSSYWMFSSKPTSTATPKG